MSADSLWASRPPWRYERSKGTAVSTDECPVLRFSCAHDHCFSQGQTEVKFFLHNHLRFTILYHKDAQTDLARIVGFEVEPFSVKHTYEGAWDKTSPVLDTCNPGRMIYVTHNLPPQPVSEGIEVIFTYDVRFVVSAQLCEECEECEPPRALSSGFPL